MEEHNKPLAYTANDWFYLKSECAKNMDDPRCTENKDAVNQFRNSADRLGSESAKYNDAKILYNRELLFTVNMLVGLALILYYLYVNKSTLNLINITGPMNTLSEKLTSATSKLSMGPPK